MTTKLAMATKSALPADPEATKAHAEKLVNLAMLPTTNAAILCGRFGNVSDAGEFWSLSRSLAEQCEAVNRGELTHAEHMLLMQAQSLDAIFTNMAQRAAVNLGEYLDATETYMKLALRAQSQCRATLETLAAIKNPPVVFAKQANIAHGHQQVNNGLLPTRAEKNENKPNELLGHDDDEWLDSGAAGTASGSDPAMEAVEIIDGPAHGSGKGRRQP